MRPFKETITIMFKDDILKIGMFMLFVGLLLLNTNTKLSLIFSIVGNMFILFVLIKLFFYGGN